MQLTNTFFPNSAIFIEKKWVENRLWGKSGFLWGKELIHCPRATSGEEKLAAKVRQPLPHVVFCVGQRRFSGSIDQN